MKIIKYILLIIFFSLLLLSILEIKKAVDILYTPIDIDHTLCEIQYGDTGKSISKKLYENNIISNKKLFSLLIRYKDLDKSLKAGHYLFTGKLNMFDVLDLIVSGEILVDRVTIPEGFSVYRTLKLISSKGIGNYDKYLLLVKDKDFILSVTGFNVDSLEGFLYPDTYIFGYDMNEENVLKAMVKNFYSRLDQACIIIDDKEQFYKELILASIVEKEVIFNDEKPLIAGVYINRLKNKMKLQACPTVTYYLEPEFKYISNLTYTETRNPSPHNTYVISGLPPTPICSPAVSTMFATLNPDKTPYLFFFADRKGRHIFSKNYKDHIRMQNELGKSPPS